VANRGWYATREDVKRAENIYGTDRDAVIDRMLEAATAYIEERTQRFFLPRTETRKYTWPQRDGIGWQLRLDQGLISVSSLKDNDGADAIAAADYFLEPNNYGPPYNRIEIDLGSNEAYQAGATPQQTIHVAGDWGWKSETDSAGTAAEAIDATETAVDVSDASLINVGDVILINAERMFVSDKAALDTTAALNGDLTATKSQVSVTVTNGALVKKNEIVQLDSEQMLVKSISGNVLTVERAYNGTVLAAHTGAVAVNAFRTLTVTRGVNGSTAATHASGDAITRYRVPRDIEMLCRALAISWYQQEQAAWGRQLGTGEGQQEFSAKAVMAMEHEVVGRYRRMMMGAA